MASFDICPITGKGIQSFDKNGDTYTYQVDIAGKKYPIKFCRNCYHTPDFEKHRHVLCGMLLNGKLDGQVIHWDSNDKKEEFNLKVLLNEGDYPKTPKQKRDNLFLGLVAIALYDGANTRLESTLTNLFWNKYYFKNNEEFAFYIHALEKEGDIAISSGNLTQMNGGYVFVYRITYQGLNKAIAMEEEGVLSKNCFVAMSFKNEPQSIAIRGAIKAALKHTQFNVIIIDEENINSDTTINDAIIAGLRKCKFCIADFTGQSKGVYFESGFAIGQGKKVIYCCEKKDFEANAHFDIKPLQHIIYETPDELEKLLIDKIEAWVK